MSMLPFATRTDMIEALKRADAKIWEVDSFLNTFLAKHDAAGAGAQLKTLWIAHVRAVLQDQCRLMTRRHPRRQEQGVLVFVTWPRPRQIARDGPAGGWRRGCSRRQAMLMSQWLIADSIGCQARLNGQGQPGLNCMPAAMWHFAINTLKTNFECNSTDRTCRHRH